MKPAVTTSLLLFPALLVLACGARTPLDEFADDGIDHSGGGWGNGGWAPGGSPGGGGIIGWGGSGGYGGQAMGGWPGSGGWGPGGSPATGGTYVTGGRRVGGNGGNVGGATGGRGGTSTGGTFVTGGTGGVNRTGGSPATGGSYVTGGSYLTGGRYLTGGSAGSGGFAGTGGTTARGGVSGTGGFAGSGGVTAPCPPLGSNEELIDDLNDGDRYLPTLSGRSGAWKVAHDGSPNGKMFPAGDFVPSQTGDSCRKYAAYAYGAGYVDWGVNISFGLGAPYDASAYAGLSFWAKVDPGTSSVVRVALPDKDTAPDGNLCTETGPNACYDHYGGRVTLTTSWTRYEVRFSQFTHGSWGRGGTGFDPSTVYEVLFQMQEGATFGYWIDDVAFVK